MKKICCIIAVLAVSLGSLWADDTKKPAYQIADNTFFDPTRKVEKEQSYQFSVDYRLEVGYAQDQQRSRNQTYADMYLHGVRVGATFTFNLPIHFSLQTGVLYTLLYGLLLGNTYRGNLWSGKDARGDC